MERPIVSGALTVMLVAMSVGLGLILAGGGGLGGQFSGGGARSQTTEAPLVRASFFSVRAQMAAGGLGTGSSEPLPIADAKFVILGLPKLFQGRPQLSQVTTNSSGFGEITLPPGNFTVVGTGPNFNYNGTLHFRPSTITALTVEVVPAQGVVSSVKVVNQDTLVGVEQTGTIYVGVPANVTYATDTVAELAWDGATLQSGATGPLQGGPLLLTYVRVVGSYSSPEGTTVVLRPAGPLSNVPSYGLTLLQYRLNVTVSYIAV